MRRIFKLPLIRPFHKIASEYYHSVIERAKNKDIIREWLKSGKTIPPPHAYKQLIVINYGKENRIKILIETGTYLGDMVYACRRHFKQIYSIELDKKLAIRASERFKLYKQIEILQGDSTDELPLVLSAIKKPTLFWLDGHYSEGITAKGKLNTPILQELTHILNHPLKNHTILIDDARCFNGTDDYPTLEELKSLVNNQIPKMDFEVIDDIIRITPIRLC
jgi:hypothetical protein